MESVHESKDVLKRFIEDHEMISEYVEDFGEMVDFLHEEETWSKIRSAENFCKQNLIGHFKFEEEVVFPVILSGAATPESIRLILELQKEHGSISKEAGEFQSLIPESSSLLNEEINEKLNFIGRNLFNSKLRHASKEDDKLLPILKKNQHLFENPERV